MYQVTTIETSSETSVQKGDLYPTWSCCLKIKRARRRWETVATYHSGLVSVTDLCCLEYCVFLSHQRESRAHVLTFDNSLGAYFRDLLLVLKTIFNLLIFCNVLEIFAPILIRFFPENSFDKEIAPFLILTMIAVTKAVIFLVYLVFSPVRLFDKKVPKYSGYQETEFLQKQYIPILHVKATLFIKTENNYRSTFNIYFVL